MRQVSRIERVIPQGASSQVAAKQLVTGDGLHRVAPPEVLASYELDFGEATLREAPKGQEELADVLTGEAVLDVQTLLFGLDQPSRTKNLEVLGCVCDREGRLIGEHLDGPGPLTEQIEQLKPLRRGDRFSQARKLLVDGVFEVSIGRSHAQVSC